LHCRENVRCADAKQQHAVLAANAPIIRQWRSSMSPHAPRVLIEPTE
jgi:hypothetical protein